MPFPRPIGLVPAFAAIDGVVAGHLHDDGIVLVISTVREALDLLPIEALLLVVPDHFLCRLGWPGVSLTPAAQAHAQRFIGARAEAANRASLRFMSDEMRSEYNTTRHHDLPSGMLPGSGWAFCSPAGREYHLKLANVKSNSASDLQSYAQVKAHVSTLQNRSWPPVQARFMRARSSPRQSIRHERGFVDRRSVSPAIRRRPASVRAGSSRGS